MRLTKGRLIRSARHSATAVLAVGALAVAAAPASADEIGVLELTQASGIATGLTAVDYPFSGTPLLDHFFFRDVNDDQHLDIISARPRQQTGSSKLEVAFSDQTQNEQFEYRVAHQVVSSSGLSTGTLNDICRGQCTRRIDRPAGDFVFVITGFVFNFTTADHHIDVIGIRQSGNDLTHWFNDQNNDDEYRVSIDYAWVPRSRFSTVATISAPQPVQGTGQVTRDLPSGNKAIRGFYVDNLGTGGSGDNHIKRFGFLTNSNTVDIYYGDINPADSADWTYDFDYAILN